MQAQTENLKSSDPVEPESLVSGAAVAARERAFRALFDAHYAFIWRLLRRLGVPADGVDDAAQELFVVAARRFDDIKAGSERAFLFGIARRLAANLRRTSFEQSQLATATVPREPVDEHPDPEQALEGERARAMLELVLNTMEDETREVFVLFELEELSKGEVAELLGIPEGTAASRLRRAREEFLAIARRAKARQIFEGGKA